jgi:hypothetical protein
MPRPLHLPRQHIAFHEWRHAQWLTKIHNEHDSSPATRLVKWKFQSGSSDQAVCVSSVTVSITLAASCSSADSSQFTHLRSYMEQSPSWKAHTQLVKRFLTFYTFQRFITVFVRDRHWSLSWGKRIQLIPPHSIFPRSILILSSHLRLRLSSGLFASGFPTKFLYAFLISRSRGSSVGMGLGYGLDDRGSRVRFPAGTGNFSVHYRVKNCSGAHPASYPMGERGCFLGGKAAGAWSWPLTST